MWSHFRHWGGLGDPRITRRQLKEQEVGERWRAAAEEANSEAARRAVLWGTIKAAVTAPQSCPALAVHPVTAVVGTTLPLQQMPEGYKCLVHYCLFKTHRPTPGWLKRQKQQQKKPHLFLSYKKHRFVFTWPNTPPESSQIPEGYMESCKHLRHFRFKTFRIIKSAPGESAATGLA